MNKDNTDVGESTAQKLSAVEQKSLQQYEETIQKGLTESRQSFETLAKAFYAIKQGNLFRQHATFEAYSKEKWDIGKSHTYRMLAAGRILSRIEQSPHGETIKKFTGEAHFRPLSGLDEDEQDRVVAKVAAWCSLTGSDTVTPKVVGAAALIVHPPESLEGNEKGDEKRQMAGKFVAVVQEAKKSLPEGTSVVIQKVFDRLLKKAEALGNPRRATGIDWTDHTWNPLLGCTRASAGCDNCYAAKLMATRLAHKHPDLATVRDKAGKKSYAFTGKVVLVPGRMAEPLEDRTPRLYFVNSMSDLFHKEVPDAFIREVFGVMEAASWHKFQVLTKRPERMAAFSQEYFKDRPAPVHIWLGTSTEDQKTFDERLPHLLKTKTAVRWLSCEPLIGEIKAKTIAGVDWVVVGGESGSSRPMEAAWARSLRDVCNKEGVAFFFKQWGEFGEDGKKLEKPKKKKDGLTPKATLDGVTHNAYPTPKTEVQK